MVIYSIKDDTITLRDESTIVSYNLDPQGGSIEGLVQGSMEPSTGMQTLQFPEGAKGFSSVAISPVTAAIDPDIKPENIVEGVTILGTEGTAYAFPDFSALGYNSTESTHAFIAWLDKKSAPYASVPSMLEGLKQDIQDSVDWCINERGMSTTKGCSYLDMQHATVPFFLKPLMMDGANRSNDNGISVEFYIDPSDSLIYMPTITLKAGNTAPDDYGKGNTKINFIWKPIYFEGFIWNSETNLGTITPFENMQVMSVSNSNFILFNDFNPEFKACLYNVANANGSIYRNGTLMFKMNGVNMPLMVDTESMFNSTTFTKGFDGSIYLPAATDTHDMFRNCRWQDLNHIESVSCPESLNASFMFTGNASNSNTVDSSLYIGSVSLPKATNVEQMFRYLDHIHIEGPIDIHSATDAENFFCWTEPSNGPVPAVTFGPIDQTCHFFYNTYWPASIDSWDTSLMKNANAMFGDYMVNLVSIGLMDFSAVESASPDGICAGNGGRFGKLTDVAGFTGLKLSINFSSALNLTAASVNNIITQAADCSALESKPTLTLHADAYARVTEETKTLASTKGWIIAQA